MVKSVSLSEDKARTTLVQTREYWESGTKQINGASSVQLTKHDFIDNRWDVVRPMVMALDFPTILFSYSPSLFKKSAILPNGFVLFSIKIADNLIFL